MTRILLLSAAAILVASCSRSGGNGGNEAAGAQPDLETAAIAAGVIRDPASTDITGLYARDTDRVCIVPAATDFRIGATVDYDEGQNCSATGSISKSGETLRVAFDGAAGCRFDARFDGDRIVFPGTIPAACDRLCSGRASFAAVSVDQLSDSASEAATLTNVQGKPLCTN